MLADYQVRQGCERRYFEIGLSYDYFGCRCVLTLTAIHPDGRDSQRMSRNRIVIKTFCNMQQPASFDLQSIQEHLEVVEGWFVALCLLSGHDAVELHPQLWSCHGKQVVIDVGENCQLELGL